jgi:hypothetical protein
VFSNWETETCGFLLLGCGKYGLTLISSWLLRFFLRLLMRDSGATGTSTLASSLNGSESLGILSDVFEEAIFKLT